MACHVPTRFATFGNSFCPTIETAFVSECARVAKEARFAVSRGAKPTQNKSVTSSGSSSTLTRKRDRLRFWTCLGAAALPLLWIVENLVGERTTLTALLAYAPQHGWGIVPALCGAIALKKRRFRLALLNGGALAFWAWALMGLRWHPGSLRQSPQSVRVVTYNVALRDRGVAQLVNEIRAQHPDIICLQEARRTFPPEHVGENNVGAAMMRFLPGWHIESAGDTCILSRFPVVASRSHPLRLGRRTLDVRVQTPHGPFRVLSTHISTAFSGQAHYHGLLGQLREIVPNAQRAAQARLDQIAPLDAALDADTRTPLVLCGDFNTTPRGLFYRHLRSRLRDGFADGGNGLGLSFPSRLPLLRIDYIWTRGARARSVHVAPPGNSDHRMVVADIELKP